jgi:ketosteroid isomerase-like protein
VSQASIDFVVDGLRDGKVARIVEYFDETEALGAIGL